MTDKTDSKEREALRTIAEWPITKTGQFDAMDAVNMAAVAKEALAASAGTAITPETGNPATAQGATITSESGAASADGCQHESDGFTYTSIPPKKRCKKCGAVYTLGGPQAASAGSEPVAHTKGVFEFWWADHMPNATHAEAWREWCHLLRPGAVTVTHPSPPEGMVMVPIALAIDSPIRDVLITWMEKGIKGECFLYKDMWEAIIDAAPPTTTAGSGKGE